MKYKSLHRWDLSPEEAVRLQCELSTQVVIAPLEGRLDLVAGADARYEGEIVRGAVVVVGLPRFETIESCVAERPVEWPYRPGLFAFREGPVLLDCFGRLGTPAGRRDIRRPRALPSPRLRPGVAPGPAARPARRGLRRRAAGRRVR
ncbi:MAG: endonuclease V [Candidatus Glassbacteria bacterium]